MHRYLIPALFVLAPAVAAAACPAADGVAALARQWADKIPANGVDKDMNMADAECARGLLLQELGKSQGRVVGYKAGLTNPAVQKRFGHAAPVRGVLLEKMLLADGAEVAAKFGSRPVFEADLVVEVRDEGVNDARSPAEVMAHLSRVVPFIELPDLVLDPKETLNGPVLVAINVGARLGVMGRGLAASPDLVEPLARMTVVMRDTADGGKELGRGSGGAILDHPLNAVIWLAQDLARSGERLKAGDLLSLGSFTPLVPPRAGMAIEASYEGLPGNPVVSVKFK